MSERVYAVITVARQIEGEYVAIRTEKAFRKAGKADELLKKLKQTYSDPDGKVRPVKITTPHGELDCICEVGAFDLEIED